MPRRDMDTQEDVSDGANLGIARPDLPITYRRASDRSGVGQKRYVRLNQADLFLVLFGAVMGTSWTFGGWVRPRIQATGIVLAMVGSLVLRTRGLLDAARDEWFDGRSVAESIKSLSWQFMLRLPPFDGDLNTASKEFERLVLEIARSPAADEHPSFVQEPVGPTGKMALVFQQPETVRQTIYIRDRLEPQIGWYAKESKRSVRLSRYWSWAGTVAQATTLGIGLYAISSPNGLSLVGLLATISASTTAWTQLKRYDETAKGYGLARDELQRIHDELASPASRRSTMALLLAAETAVSREHKVWIDRRRAAA